MFAIVKDGEIRGVAQSVQKLFPNVSFSGAPSAEFKKENGVMDVINGEIKDRTFYFVTTDGSPTLVDGVPTQKYTNTPKDVDALKKTMTSKVKDTAYTTLCITDWMVIRKAERGVDIPSDMETYRAAVITECSRLKAAISEAADVDALAAVMGSQNWPKGEDNGPNN